MSDGPILVVDDDRAIREMLADVLRFEGYAVELAADGAEALAVLERVTPSLVLLDMRMPVVDGWEFARLARARGLAAPIIVMTAAANAQRWCDEIDGTACLAKPFDVPDLLATVEGARRSG